MVGLARKRQRRQLMEREQTCEVVTAVERASMVDYASRRDIRQLPFAVYVGGRNLLVGDVVRAIPDHRPVLFQLVEAEQVGNSRAVRGGPDARQLGGDALRPQRRPVCIRRYLGI